jgi:AraC-like DNA-binding protein
MVEPTVSAGYVNSFLKVVAARGADNAALLARAGIDAQDLSKPDTRVPFIAFKTLMRAAKAMLDDPALALRFGEDSPFDEMSIVGLVCMAAETMGQAFEQMNRYARLVIEVEGHESGDRFAIVPAGNGLCWLEDRRKNPNDFPELTESTWARFVAPYRKFFPDRPHYVKAVHMPHAEPPYRAEYDRVFPMPVAFESERNALLITQSWLSERTRFGNTYVFGIFSDRAASLLKSLEESKTLQGRIERLLIPILHTGDLGMDATAKRIGLSRATLYRKLRDEGTNYEDLLDDLRHRMALHYLDGKKVSVNQAAYLVGFSDPSAFSRAFKRWTGKSPAQRKA